MNENTVHFVNGKPLCPPFPHDTERALFGLGCFWGAERCFWSLPDVHVTAVGYAGGSVANPSYRRVCTGATGHAEVVLVVYRGGDAAYRRLLSHFWQAHDPTQGMRSGNDIGTQYRSVVFCANPAHYRLAVKSREAYQERLDAAEYAKITTTVVPMPPFYYAEDYHQQYLAKNPNGYCGIRGLGVSA